MFFSVLYLFDRLFRSVLLVVRNVFGLTHHHSSKKSEILLEVPEKKLTLMLLDFVLALSV